MKRIIQLCLLFTMVLFLGSQSFGLDYYIATNGDDTNVGSKEKPFATLEGAQKAIRELKDRSGLPVEGICVYIRGGIYFREMPFFMTQEDSGHEDSRVIYSGYPGEEVRLLGGKILNTRNFDRVDSDSPVWDRLDDKAKGNVMVIDLAEEGITNFGELRPRGFAFRSVVSHLELSFNHEMMQLARWPNDGFVKTGESDEEKTFTFANERMQRWVDANDPWAFGYFKHGWADQYVAIDQINLGEEQITLNREPNYGLFEDKEWYILNLLEEIDTPGEWYLDRESGLLYFWPPESMRGAEVIVSTFGEGKRSIIEMNNCKYVTLRGLTIEMGRFDGIRVEDADHVTISKCLVRNMGSQGVRIDGMYSGIEDSIIYGVGGGGVHVDGGNRSTLLHSNNFVRNCHIHHFSRWSRTYNPGIGFRGVGHLISHNLLHDAPHSAILFGGNEHLIEFNEIHNVCLESDDAGSLYCGRDWGIRGNIIRYNFFHHIDSELEGSHGVHAVYLDDCASGLKVFGNVFYDISGRGVMCGGGRDNQIINNIFVKCGSAHFTDRRGKVWVVDEPGDSWNLLEKIKRYNYTEPPWSTAYPKLAKIMDDGYEMAKEPEGCVISTNIGWKNDKWLEENCLGACDGFDFYTIENNLKDVDPHFVNEDELNLELQDDSPAYSLPGFETIPFDTIGLLNNGDSDIEDWQKRP